MKKYPHSIQIIKYDYTLTKYCGVRLWSKWSARVQIFKRGRKYPKTIVAIYLKKPDAPLKEVRVKMCEVKFLTL